jgi:hypothetical protein
MEEHIVFCGFCPACDWEYWAKSEKAEKMFERLHRKKCKKTGRTKQPECKKRLDAEQRVFNKSHEPCKNVGSSSLKIFSGKEKSAEFETKNRRIQKTFNVAGIEKLMQVTLTK